MQYISCEPYLWRSECHRPRYFRFFSFFFFCFPEPVERRLERRFCPAAGPGAAAAAAARRQVPGASGI